MRRNLDKQTMVRRSRWVRQRRSWPWWQAHQCCRLIESCFQSVETRCGHCVTRLWPPWAVLCLHPSAFWPQWRRAACAGQRPACVSRRGWQSQSSVPGAGQRAVSRARLQYPGPVAAHAPLVVPVVSTLAHGSLVAPMFSAQRGTRAVRHNGCLWA